MAACGGTNSPVSVTAALTSAQSTAITPTETPSLPEPTQSIPTSTTTTISTLVPAITPENDELGLRQFPDPAQFGWQLILSGLRSPIGLANAGDGSGRLFVTEQAGRILVISDRELLEEPFLDISQKVSLLWGAWFTWACVSPAIFRKRIFLCKLHRSKRQHSYRTVCGFR